MAREVDRLGDRVWGDAWFVSPATRLTVWVLAGGMLVFILAGLTQPAVERELNLPVVSKPGPVLNVLVYVLLAALLLGQVQYLRAQRQHENHHVVLEAGFREDWGQSFGVFAALAAVVVMLALLLPTARTGSLLVGVGEEAWSGLSAALQHLAGSHYGSAPACGQGSLLGARSEPEHGPYMPALGVSSRHRGPPIFPPQRVRRTAPTMACSSLPSRPAVAQGPPVPATSGDGQRLSLGFVTAFVHLGAPVLKALLLWFILLASLLYRVRHGLARRSGDRGMPISPGRLLRDLRSLWLMLLHGARGYALSLGRPAANRVQTPERVSAPPAQRPCLPLRWPLSPRDRVLHYYGAMLRHAGRHGFSRPRWQTPREFARAVAQKLPESRKDMRLLTETYMEARYSRHEIGTGHVGTARAAWRRLRVPFRRVGK
jgi:hypothetical protein